MFQTGRRRGQSIWLRCQTRVSGVPWPPGQTVPLARASTSRETNPSASPTVQLLLFASLAFISLPITSSIVRMRSSIVHMRSFLPTIRLLRWCSS